MVARRGEFRRRPTREGPSYARSRATATATTAPPESQKLRP
jgi:hypothetical protein